jgi:hypothetical protein
MPSLHRTWACSNGFFRMRIGARSLAS